MQLQDHAIRHSAPDSTLTTSTRPKVQMIDRDATLSSSIPTISLSLNNALALVHTFHLSPLSLFLHLPGTSIQ